MCSIFGVGFQNEHALTEADKNRVHKFVDALFVNCMERGRHASGLAFVGATDIKVVKKDILASAFIKTPEYKKCFEDYFHLEGGYYNRTLSLVGHCRFQTKGTYLKNVNNHPIVRKDVVGVHNGCIGNDDFLFNKYSKDIIRNGEVDSEIIFALIEHHTKEQGSISKAIKRTCDEVRGSLACAAVHVRQPHLVWLFKGWGPCHVTHYLDVGLVAWASAEAYINNAETTSNANFGRRHDIFFDPKHMLCLDMHRNSFKLEPIGGQE